MMNVQDILDMYDHNYWANHRILSMAEKVTPEQFSAPSTHSFSSLHATLVHIMDVEWCYRLLLEGGSIMDEELKPADFPTVEAVRQRWQEEEQAMRNYLAGLHDEDLAGIVSLREHIRWHLLYDVVSHGTQHRSEAANLLTVYGQSPGDIDFSRFLNERAAAKA